ncbi:hypothetical protein CBER1_10787 [Cercospora berteroae]|uniref:C2H2-type domain-containing protein n=1 Tax=Cercospora berteroae TaxID=357750 RepID=A0A2S6CF60_9PEZI|nr:hypothetical protein CBER1_10787 [Cercospora berteroae]
MQRDNRSPSSDPDQGRTSCDDFDQRVPWSATLLTTEPYYFHGGARTSHVHRRSDCGDSEQTTYMQSPEDHRSRFTSPTYSGTSAGGPPSIDSSRSDCNSSPRVKTEPGSHWVSQPTTPFFESIALPHAGCPSGSHHTAPFSTYVAMNDVQAQEDSEFDDIHSSSLGRGIFPYPSSGPYPPYPPTHDEDVPNYGQVGLASDISSSSGPWDPNPERSSRHAEDGRPVNFRHRRTPSDRTATGRVRRPPNSRRGSSNQQSIRSRSANRRSGRPQNLFPCLFVVYGCDKEVGSKNEWKRHIQKQHVQMEYWLCTRCPEKGPSEQQQHVFNRKDLFTQHTLRMHSQQSDRAGKAKSDEQKRFEDTEAERCHRTLRQPPNDSRCVICEQEFSGPGSWEQCIDHTGRHLDTAAKEVPPPASPMLDPNTWHPDYALQQYLQRENILTIDDRGYLALRSTN